jgi:predicted metal-binding membrane protein
MPAWLRVLVHQRVVVTIGLAAAIIVSWLYMLPGGGMDWAMAAMPRGHPADWSLDYAALTFLMWAMMMAAMMLPSAAPMMLLHARVVGGKGGPSAVRQCTAFALAYLGVWTGASLLATVLQWGLDHGRLLDPMLTSTSTVLTALLLVGAGAWQFTPLKQRCLSRCRSPLGFLMSAWRPGVRGSAIMGLHHGVLCLGCCWGLMLLLFVAGAMNFTWIVAIATYVLIEKVAPHAEVLVPVSGAGLIIWGVALLAWSLAA